MKNIVVGIDFSQNSVNALRHGAAIAIKSNAKIHIVWVKTPGAATKLGFTDEEQLLKKANTFLDDLVASTRAEVPKSEVQSVILEGKAYLKLTQYAANLPESILVVGSHGASGFEEMFVGSNTMKVVGISKVPILIIGNNVQINRDLTRILVPIDTSFETLQKMKTAILFAKLFSAQVVLLGIYDSPSADIKHIINIQLNHAVSMCHDANVRYSASTLEIHGQISKATVNWAADEDVNLLVVMREEEDDISSFWLGSNTRQLVNYASMPILVIPNVDHFAINK